MSRGLSNKAHGPEHDEATLAENDAKQARGKATVVIEAVIEHAYTRMAFGAKKFALKLELSGMLFGTNADGTPKQMMSGHAYEKIRCTVRATRRLRATVQLSEARESSIAFWEEMTYNEDVQWQVRARAQENLDNIFGVRAPEVSLQIQAKSNSVKLADLGLDLEAKKKALARLRAAQKAREDAEAMTAALPVTC